MYKPSLLITYNQFRIKDHKNFRLDRNCFGGRLILYINENILGKPLQENIHLPNFEVIAMEFYQNNQKWLLLGFYKPPNQKTNDFIQNLSLILALFLKNYETSHLLEILISPAIMFILKVFCKHIT